MKIKYKFENLLVKIAIWQPRPYISYCASGPLSKWFYRKQFKRENSPVIKNWLGEKWSDFWWNLIQK